MPRSKTNNPSSSAFNASPPAASVRSPRAGLKMAACLLCLIAPTAPAGPGSLWKAESSTSMFADKRARIVGDLLTILIQENSTASKDNSTKTSKSSSVDGSLETILYSPGASGFLTKGGKLPAMKFGGSQSFDGGGTINNTEKITSRIAVRVADVLPNGNLIIEGRRETFVSGEKQEVILRGTVRGEDVTANNTVFSFNVADANISFVSKGTITDNQRKGWLHKAWEKITPF